MLTLENLALCESMSHLNIARAAIPGGWLVYITHTTSNEGGCCYHRVGCARGRRVSSTASHWFDADARTKLPVEASRCS